MANYQELANLVWNVADEVLRDLFKPHEYGDITSRFSCCTHPAEQNHCGFIVQ